LASGSTQRVPHINEVKVEELGNDDGRVAVGPNKLEQTRSEAAKAGVTTVETGLGPRKINIVDYGWRTASMKVTITERLDSMACFFQVAKRASKS
jgi:hypothetical protein